MLLAGSAAVPLTPGLDLPFGSRTPVADGWTEVRDELWARALFFDDTYHQVAIVGVDLFTIDLDLVRTAGRLAWEWVRISPNRVFVVPTGCQTAPLTATLPGWPPRPEPYSSYVAEQIASAVVYAARARTPAGLGWAPGWQGGPTVLKVEPDAGGRDALLAGLPWLPGGGGRELSADYPGATAEFLRRLAPSLGYVGALGPCSPAPDEDPVVLGERLGALAWAAAPAAEIAADVRCQVASEKVALPFALPEVEVAAGRLEAAEEVLDRTLDPLLRRTAERDFEHARQAFAAAQAGVAREREVELTAVRLGDGAFIASPLLLSPDVGRAVAARSAFGDRTLCGSGVGGVLGVLTAPGEALAGLASWYAALPFAAAAVERYVAAVERLTAQVVEPAEPAPDPLA